MKISQKTLRLWDKAGKLKTVRTEGGHRRIPVTELEKYSKQENTRNVSLCYARCSTQKQQDNLERQVGRILEYCVTNGWKAELYKDIGSGLNDNRKQFKKLLKRISHDDIARVVVEYKDRIARYGFELFKSFCESYGVEIVIMKECVKKEFEEELVDDMIAIVTSFSARMYGRRGGKRK